MRNQSVQNGLVKKFFTKFNFSTALQNEAEAKYANTLRFLHWGMAASILGAFGFVQLAKGCDKSEQEKKVCTGSYSVRFMFRGT
jgi:hypothetical protein